MPGLEMATHQDNIAASEGPTLKSGKTLQGVKIALPGFSSGEKPKLRSKPRPSPPTDPVPNENTPPWMGESRLRKSRPPRGEVEKMKQETEPEKPSWMKDAAAKRRRASQLLIAKERQDSEAEEQTSSPSTTAPWLVESASRRRHSNLNSDPSMEVDDAFLPHNEDEQHAKVVLASNGVNSDQSCDDDSSVPAWRLEIKSRRKSRPPSVLPEKPPMEEDIPLWKKELAERRKTRGDSVAAIESIKVGPKTEEEDVVPPWKLEIEERKKKSLTSTASHRVFNPLNPDPLSPSVKSETPEWAKLAAERRARRKQSTHLDELERQVEINDPN
ncbi:hypothetical protein CAPTEDRAFT_222176 [Capitella teleta]|uniref:Uncharacterized protein n=1 Tax=Capitella teleta TaxID=283909 RepID=X2ASX6_CAPTE|nr:hypothetical protein CAPTEDRAFT_222176 [Capitella teleta]|eukprot:ELT88435.1 hypothetical protein CAPTEDRAFT_222176 [Capitella teleta]